MQNLNGKAIPNTNKLFKLNWASFGTGTGGGKSSGSGSGTGGSYSNNNKMQSQNNSNNTQEHSVIILFNLDLCW
jgi:hypothetical protein